MLLLSNRSIVGATYIEEESLRKMLEDFVGSGEWRGERRMITVGSDEETRDSERSRRI